ncbi:hypothetical protein RhiLY_01963 [Ceratobasidium sp. AG-Ba]|nr:hypothetical protein RhiLY_01963 [Ceratobasidium sp. AG-Ba]
MSLFRSSSFRIKKRDKSHRPPPLEQMPEWQERESLEHPPASAHFLQVPDSARSAFFTLPSAGHSRSSLFRSTSGASSSSQQEDKPRTSNGFFKLSNLSKGSFVSTLRRDRGEPARGRNTLDIFKPGAGGDTAGDMKEHGYIPYSKRQRPESAELSMSGVFAGLDVIDIAPPVQRQLTPHRQRSRTLSTKSAPDPDTPDGRRSLQLQLLTDFPLPAHTPSRSSLDTPSLRRHQSSFLPRPSLDTPALPLPELRIPPGRADTLLSLSTSSSEGTKLSLHSPSPTIISATSVSTARDSLMGSYDAASSESDPELCFSAGENKCRSSGDSCEQTIDATPSKPAHSRHSRLLPPLLLPRSPNRPGQEPSSFPGSSALSDAIRSPSCDPPGAHFSPEEPSELSDDPITPLEAIAPKIKPKLSSGQSTSTPARKLTVRAGNTPPARRLKIRRPSSIIARSVELSEDTPPTPSTPSFVVGLAWPRPPFRQVYVDTRDPGSSWHSVSNATDDCLVDGGGNVIVEPCHIIMLAHAIDSFTLPPDIGVREPLSPTAASALAMFALTCSPLVSA